jgi:hypothetical protein
MPVSIWSQRGEGYAVTSGDDTRAEVKAALAADDWYEYETGKEIRSSTIMRVEDTPEPTA